MNKKRRNRLVVHNKLSKICQVMKLGVFLMVVFITNVTAGTLAQKTMTVTGSQLSFKEIFSEIHKQTGYTVVYNNHRLNSDYRLNVNFKNTRLDVVLREILEGTGLTYELMDEFIILSALPAEPQKGKIILGKVTDGKKIPMPGVTVRLDSATVGTASDVNGMFRLSLPMEKGTLVFSFVGYKTKKVNFSAATRDTIRVVLEEDVSDLDEVTVVAYGSQKRRLMTSAVSSIKGSEIQELPTHSLESLLQGRMAGVEVNNLSGAPGGGGSIVAIRGYTSIGAKGEGEDREYGTPLYVVDGVPIQSFTSSVTGANTIADLDPAMIESIEVLKDAAAAALYGSRAGNGVILITTKKGRVGKSQLSAKFSYSASWLPKTPEVTGGHGERMYALNALKRTVEPYYDVKTKEWKVPTSYEEVYNLVGKDMGPVYNYFWGGRDKIAPEVPYLQDSLNPFFNNSTDWWRYMYRTAKVINANLQMSGGNEAMQYIVGVGYFKEEGIIISSDFQRATLSANISSKPMRHLKMDFMSTFTYSDRSRGEAERGLSSKIQGISVDPNRTSSLLPGDSYVKEYMMEDLNSKIEKNNSYTARLNLKLDYEFIRDLHLSVSGSLDFNQQNLNKFTPSTLDRQNHFSKSEGDISRSIMMLNENLLNYKFKIKHDHQFGVLLGLSFEKDQKFNNSGSGLKGPNDYVHYVGKGWGGASNIVYSGGYAKGAYTYGSSLTEETMCSYFGRLSYNYKEKYILEGTIRRDGSSVFGEKVRWATFPSVSAGWAFSEEPFMKRFYWLSFGKLRGSWGTSGQKFSQPYLAQGLFSAYAYTFLGQYGMTANKKGGLINRKLSWESTDQYNLGLDLDLMDYRFKVVLDYYYRYTKDQLNQVDLPGDTYLFDMQWQNVLETSNEGIELELQANILRETAVKWRMKLTASRNWSRFEKSYTGMDYKEQVIGKPLYQMRAYKTDGFYNTMDEVPYIYLASGVKQPLYDMGINEGIFYPGTRRILDLNGDGQITEDDQYFASSPLPQMHGGIFCDLRWKDFDLSMAFNYSLGRHILRVYDDYSLQPWETPENSIRVDLRKVHAWENENTKNPKYPRLQSYKNNGDQFVGLYDSDIENIHLLRLKQLTLGYNLNENVSKKFGLSSARIYVTAENLFLLSNYSGLDPEIVSIFDGIDALGSYPLPRKFTIGLSVNF